jgi:hypothetical protein
VIVFHEEYVQLFNGGWFTPTTRDRINLGLRLAEIPDRSVYQSKKVWYVGDFEFFDGIKIDYSGLVINPRRPTPYINLRQVKTLLYINDPRLTEGLEKHDAFAQKITRKLIDRYIKTLSKRIDDGTVPLQITAGDCWFCAMKTEQGQILGDAIKDVDHLVSHLKEQYVMLRLIIHALEHKGYVRPAIFICTVDEKNQLVPDIATIRQHKESILSAVRTYFDYKLITRLASVSC